MNLTRQFVRRVMGAKGMMSYGEGVEVEEAPTKPRDLAAILTSWHRRIKEGPEGLLLEIKLAKEVKGAQAVGRIRLLASPDLGFPGGLRFQAKSVLSMIINSTDMAVAKISSWEPADVRITHGTSEGVSQSSITKSGKDDDNIGADRVPTTPTTMASRSHPEQAPDRQHIHACQQGNHSSSLPNLTLNQHPRRRSDHAYHPTPEHLAHLLRAGRRLEFLADGTVGMTPDSQPPRINPSTLPAHVDAQCPDIDIDFDVDPYLYSEPPHDIVVKRTRSEDGRETREYDVKINDSIPLETFDGVVPNGHLHINNSVQSDIESDTNGNTTSLTTSMTELTEPATPPAKSRRVSEVHIVGSERGDVCIAAVECDEDWTAAATRVASYLQMLRRRWIDLYIRS
ncbi:hypothetical protein HDU76_011549 [Blyttiomyces sp. JEL0837]|nr:hypothetical protein HDU76_011549 [Blyttiomyces sp. JEL0837]